MRIAVVGGGITGLVSAYILAKAGVDVVVYEKEDTLGGHAKTVTIDDDGVGLDLGFMLFSHQVSYPNVMEVESLGVEMEVCDMSLSVSLQNGQGCEWGTRNGLSSLFSQKKNALNPYFWQMMREISRFQNDVIRYIEDLENNPDIDRTETLSQFVSSHGYSELFQKAYLIPMRSSIWSFPTEGVMNFSAYAVLSFCHNHHLLQLFGSQQSLTVRWRSYIDKARDELVSRGCQILSGCTVNSVSTVNEGCDVICEDGSQTRYNGCIIAMHAPDALRILGQATYDETRILGAFQYVYCDIYLHHDINLMPKSLAAWSSRNFLGDVNNKFYLTYWPNVLQNSEKGLPYLVTLNPSDVPNHTLLKWTAGYPVPSVAAFKASLKLDQIQGKRAIWFCGAYQGYGCKEDGLKAGIIAANGVLGKTSSILKTPQNMVLSPLESWARLLLTRFLRSYIKTGCLILLEEGGTVFTFNGSVKKSSLKSYLRVHNPQFYWKIVTQADLGLADAYIDGDFSVVDKNEGLLNLFMIFIANRDLETSESRKTKQRGWWAPMFLTAGIASAKYFFQHVSRQNTLTQARRNISHHYDLSNEHFAMFLGETMNYSCAIFKMEGEDLKTAQQRKMTSLIEKARVEKHHKVLDIGCGWGSLAVEVVKQTGCEYTGITLSEEQLSYAEKTVKEAGLQNNIRLLLCDYRQLKDTDKYDRIISCEMIEHVGHEYIEEFFGCCESLLAEDGLFVLQFISMPEDRYDEYIKSPGFIKEYIFPGGSLPSFSTVISAMATASRLCVEHVESLGIHYYPTLRCWRRNFLENQSKVLGLGFDQKFIRTWEYYFDYCAAGFKSRTLGDYQVVFSRPGNVATLGGDPYAAALPSFQC